ncbi:MAG: DUF3048 domain-containing protein [Lachnospiraceae bacterium]|nr:DUF3048 domain-containing protein [Lachnospiraceae bacterium]
MKKNKTLYKITAIAALSVMSLSLLSGCGKKNNKNVTEAPIEATFNVSPISNMTSAEDIQVFYKDGMVISDLTGEWIDESLAKQRPLCIMINNIIDAMPQSGLSQADITYEFVVEGGITRLMCVFKDYQSGIEKLGPVRSSRHYYAQMAYVLDGIYAHFGWSPYAEMYIESIPGYQNLNGLELEGTMYYRDSSRVAPHNVYTDSEGIMAGINKKGYDMTHSSSYEYNNFKFNYNDTPLASGNTANKVTTAFSNDRMPWFEYNSEDSRYYRYQYGDKQIDANTGEQLSYKNIIVMFAVYEQIDDYGCQNIVWDSEGTTGDGYYITDGEYIPITWTKGGAGLIYKTEDGNQLKMNPGNTYISVMKANESDSRVIFE